MPRRPRGPGARRTVRLLGTGQVVRVEPRQHASERTRMEYQFSIIVAQPSAGQAAYLGSGVVMAGDNPIGYFLEPDQHVSISIDQREAEHLLDFLRTELGR